ncbi:hypothetical protein Scep_023750 [Stephania cephalantha]|uniref:Uncharacterized protein n=1 Tax=Stephania cephalantha TaxID=152367 RepID=A0AAP0HXS7_9MAGN
MPFSSWTQPWRLNLAAMACALKQAAQQTSWPAASPRSGDRCLAHDSDGNKRAMWDDGAQIEDVGREPRQLANRAIEDGRGDWRAHAAVVSVAPCGAAFATRQRGGATMCVLAELARAAHMGRETESTLPICVCSQSLLALHIWGGDRDVYGLFILERARLGVHIHLHREVKVLCPYV